MIQYDREILSLYVKPEKVGLKNVVSRVTWRWIVKDELNYADIYHDTYFKSVDPNNYTEYENLTDDIVFSWIDAVEDIVSLKIDLDQRLVAAKNPVIIEKPIPWTSQSKYTGNEEYLIVIDDQPNNPNKVLGPMRWNTNIANQGLKERGVLNYNFPTDFMMYQRELLPFDTPMIASNRVKVYKVEYTEQPILDNRFQYHEGLTWTTSSGKAVSTYLIIDRALQEVKEILQNQLSGISFEKQNSGTEFEFRNVTVKLNTDVISNTNLIQRWYMMEESDIINHKINNNIWAELTKTEVKEILNVIHNHISSVLNWEKDIFDQIESSSTINQLKGINF